jgi:hypothetical protein
MKPPMSSASNQCITSSCSILRSQTPAVLSRCQVHTGWSDPPLPIAPINSCAPTVSQPAYAACSCGASWITKGGGSSQRPIMIWVAQRCPVPDMRDQVA